MRGSGHRLVRCRFNHTFIRIRYQNSPMITCLLALIVRIFIEIPLRCYTFKDIVRHLLFRLSQSIRCRHFLVMCFIYLNV